MKLIPLQIQLLSHFFNYCKVTNNGCITSRFIGDLALVYALNRVLCLKDFEKHNLKPNYKEIKELPFTFSIAKPLTIEPTGIYVRNTLFIDGFTDWKAVHLAGKSVFKNFWKVQGIKVGSCFETYIIAQDDFAKQLQKLLPLTIRLGTGRECLAILKEHSPSNDIWLNGYSLANIFDNAREAIRILPSYRVDFQLWNYSIIKGFQESDIEEIFSGVFT